LSLLLVYCAGPVCYDSVAAS